MINIHTTTANEAWRQTFAALLKDGQNTDNSKYLRDEVTIIRIDKPEVEAKDELFPMSQQDLDTINNYIYSGENEDLVVHEWTKIYHHRMFDKPNSQVEYVFNKLKASELPTGEVQISIWDKTVDQSAKISPCTQILWFRKKFGKLEMHVHAHSSDAYKKLLMNILEFISLQKYIANRLNILVGTYYHFIDSCHLHHKDLVKIEELKAQLN